MVWQAENLLNAAWNLSATDLAAPDREEQTLSAVSITAEQRVVVFAGCETSDKMTVFLFLI
jgi:hypothetical protein